jgi:tetratricopeptide (TPR) repeat protein
MKRLMILIMLVALSVAAFCQVTKPVTMEELEVTPPKFTGIENFNAVVTFLEGEEATKSSPAMANYVAQNFQYPEYPEGRLYEGTEVVQFIVLPSGELTDFHFINSLSPEIDAEIIRVLESTKGMWVPGTSGGEPVAMKSEITLAIKLGGSEESASRKDFVEMARKSYKRAGELWIQGKPKRALRHYNKGIRYMPNDKGLLYMRGLCRYNLGDMDGAREDWRRLKALGGSDLESVYFTGKTEK